MQARVSAIALSEVLLSQLLIHEVVTLHTHPLVVADKALHCLRAILGVVTSSRVRTADSGSLRSLANLVCYLAVSDLLGLGPIVLFKVILVVDDQDRVRVVIHVFALVGSDIDDVLVHVVVFEGFFLAVVHFVIYLAIHTLIIHAIFLVEILLVLGVVVVIVLVYISNEANGVVFILIIRQGVASGLLGQLLMLWVSHLNSK